MNKILKFKQTPDSKVYFVSDTHFGHNRDFVFEARGYPNVEAHDDAIMCKINEVVRPSDKLVHLGDICLNTPESKFEEYLSRIQCQNVYHIWGNHNNPAWKVYQREMGKFLEKNNVNRSTLDTQEIEIYPFRYRNVTFIGNYAELSVDGHFFILSHYPMYVFNEMKNGAMHLCGHSHYSLELSQADNVQSKILDIGWDGHAKPLSLDDVLSIMSKKGILEVDHHRKGGPVSGE